MSQPTGPGARDEPQNRSGTVLETDEDLRQALISGSRRPPLDVTTIPNPPAPPQSPAGPLANPYRPTARPPVPILTVFDDGRTDGEVIRLREPRFTIGRTEGDLRFPLDGRMSSRHVEITHQVVGGLDRWVVTDLQSTHGMFVRVSKTVLADRAEIVVGNGRYRFDVNRADPSETTVPPIGLSNSGETRGLDDGPSPYRPPSMTELLGREIGNRILLVKDHYWIGSDPSCAFCRADDPFCEPRHVRLHRTSQGTWGAEHNKTQNGLWLRMTQIAVDSMIQFQVGEQRFRLKL